MRSSPASSARRVKDLEADQLALPFLVPPEVASNSASQLPAESIAALRSKRPVGEIVGTHDQNDPSRSKPRHKANDERRKPPRTVSVPPDSKLLVSRREAAAIVSLSIRSIDYLLARKQLPFRKIGTRTMIPVSELQRFARMDHPKRIAS